MTTLYLVRHAKPAATWGEATDPGLDDLGHSQADATAKALGQRLQPIPVFTSPLKRCAETAIPLTQRWQCAATIMSEVAEVPSPPLSIAERAKWLAAGMAGTWQELQKNSPPGSPDYLQWRQTLLSTLRALTHDAVIYSHYIAINVVIGAAENNDRVINFRPGHASVSVIEIRNGQFIVRELGQEADTGLLLGR